MTIRSPGAGAVADAGPRPVLHHRDSPLISESARAMLSDPHRAGCSTGRACPSTPDRDGQVRAVFYARMPMDAGNGVRVLRAAYLCARCARAFARREGIALEASHAV
jgi:hypothetical protein